MHALGILAIVPTLLLLAGVLLTACVGGEGEESLENGRGANGISVPSGFAEVKFAGGLDHPTALAFSPDGKLYVAQQNGEVLILEDADGDGIAENRKVFARGLLLPLGMTFVGGDLFVSERGKVTRVVDVDSDGVSDGVESIITGLPVGGALHTNHQNNGIAMGPDGYLYLGIGIDPTGGGDTRKEPTVEPKVHGGLGLGTPGPSPAPPSLDARAGTILRFRPDGSDATIYATGFRNPVGLAFDSNGNLIATDLGPDQPEGPDELNHVVQGADYGFRRSLAEPVGPGDIPPIVTLDVAATNGVSFYTMDAFPEDYRGNAFVAQWGQAQDDVAFTNRVIRIKMREVDGRLQGSSRTFAVGFEHPIATAVGPDGSLFVADWGSLDPSKTESGAIYRIFYSGSGR